MVKNRPFTTISWLTPASLRAQIAYILLDREIFAPRRIRQRSS
ncbi:hypothetical protein L248_1005 [Schleiferilactobacillus shenzhenensis LY-73]|uniref:Uncharacterized protein n=1 Tax=Schleiferilactobacillus shenzhenensis LY-73 TaxID=1231336 RepID=U4TR37_9LACO|nr:hypothetical protein L248_1005 [Schleiferilactobacillus shenzhenensis LY-73]